ncbi:YncE family protein [Actinoplanes sp. GCM10030250]|uniref:YncE family protein n=1 Tax=Actinoplanes sp. GCM10030250 TaxID=3273376 RepID=UPI00360A697C
MTTRRTFLLLAGSGLAATASGCREPADPTAAAPPSAAPPSAATSPSADPPDVLIAETERGLVRLAPTGEQALGPAAAAFDGAHLYTAGAGDLVQIDPATGAAVRKTTVGGGWLPRAISTDGRACALGRTPATVQPAARARSTLLIAGPAGNREYDLPGVVEPDAFTSDGQGLFVLEWFPAAAPDRYRVRKLDLGSSRLDPLFTRNKTPVPAGAEEEMRGEGRQAVLSADGQMLFTLYTHQPGHAHTRDLVSGRPGNAHAFVHVLHLTEGWAYCLDLPHPFGEGKAASCALAANARHLAVVDLSAGKMAYASPSALTIERVVDVPPAADGIAALVLTPDGRTLVGSGDLVTVLDTSAVDTGAVDTSTDAQAARWSVPGPIRGMGLSRDGKRLYAGGEGRVTWLDAAAGTQLGHVAVPGLTALRHVP